MKFLSTEVSEISSMFDDEARKARDALLLMAVEQKTIISINGFYR